MTSTFAGFSTALSALNAQRRGLDVTGQNVANANTVGYTRQRVALESVGGPAVPALWSRYDGAGGGVNAAAVQRLSDDFLSGRVQTEHARLAKLTTDQSTLGRVEQSFGEPSDTGLQSQFSDLWNAWHGVSNNPGESAPRTQLLETARTLAATFNQVDGALRTQWGSQLEQLHTVGDSTNTTAQSVAELNTAILRADQAGVPANELKDKRDALVLTLSELVGATSAHQPNGTISVKLGGVSLVDGGTATKLAVSDAAMGGPVQLTWALANGDPDPSSPVAATGGQAGGLLEAVGPGGTLVGYAAKLDAVAAQLAKDVNDQHAQGWDRSGTPGQPFFSGSTAGTLAVALTAPEQVAASGLPGTNLDGSNADKLAGFGTLANSIDAQYRSVVADLGVKAQTVNRRVDIQSDVASQVDAARESQAGVNMDEEMVNLLTYQHAYEGAAKVMSAFDEMVQTILNMAGR